MKCLSCGTDKNLDINEIYPYNGEYDGLTQEKPIEPLILVEAEGETEFRMAILCHECFHNLSENTQGVDLWISEKCWLTLNPVTPFNNLPFVIEGKGKFNPKTYEKNNEI